MKDIEVERWKSLYSGSVARYVKGSGSMICDDDESGIILCTFKDSDYHSYNDKPAITYADGGRYWYKDGMLHRDNDKPAIIYADGRKAYYRNGIDKKLQHLNGTYINPVDCSAREYVDGVLQYTDSTAEDSKAHIIDTPSIDSVYHTMYKDHVQSEEDRYTAKDAIKDCSWYKEPEEPQRTDKVTHKLMNGTVATYDDNNELHSYADISALINKNGTQYWYKHGLLHRDNDRPAVLFADGKELYYLDGMSYDKDQIRSLRERYEYNANSYGFYQEEDRIDDAKDEFKWHHDGNYFHLLKSGTVATYNEDGVLHSYSGYPALEYASGVQYWYRDGKLHRGGGMPSIVYANGNKEWYKHGQLHRGMDMPAIDIKDGTMKWYRDGVLHRDVGPAIIYKDGRTEYYTAGAYMYNGDYM